MCWDITIASSRVMGLSRSTVIVPYMDSRENDLTIADRRYFSMARNPTGENILF